MTKKYLILTASYWSWHNAAKDAFKNYIIKSWDRVEHLDLVDFLKKWWNNSRKFYELSERIPFIWDATFNLLDNEFTNEVLEIYLKNAFQKKFSEYINKYKPNYIIITFPNWPVFIKNYLAKHKKTFKSWMIITDSIEICMPWYFWSDVIDYIFVIDKFSKDVFCKKFKHKKTNIHVSFFPIEKKYFLNKTNINNKNIAILLTWLKKPLVHHLIEKLKNETFFDKLIISAWRNKELLKYIKENFEDKRFEFHDFLNIKENLKNIDIFISKPGWAVMCEFLAQDVPIICPSFTPGQEEGNIKLIKNWELWIFEKDPEKIVFYLKYLDFNKFLPNFHKFKNPSSIKYIIETLKK